MGDFFTALGALPKSIEMAKWVKPLGVVLSRTGFVIAAARMTSAIAEGSKDSLRYYDAATDLLINGFGLAAAKFPVVAPILAPAAALMMALKSDGGPDKPVLEVPLNMSAFPSPHLLEAARVAEAQQKAKQRQARAQAVCDFLKEGSPYAHVADDAGCRPLTMGDVLGTR